MQESYKVEHKEKYHISGEKVWSNVKRWWYVVAVFFILGIVAMVAYAKSTYRQQLAVYEAASASNSDMQTGETIGQTVEQEASQVELENAYYDLTQLVVCMDALSVYWEMEQEEDYQEELKRIALNLKGERAEKEPLTSAYLSQIIWEAKNSLCLALAQVPNLATREVAFCLEGGEEAFVSNSYESNYKTAFGQLKAKLSDENSAKQLLADDETLYLIPDSDSIIGAEKKTGSDDRLLKVLIISSGQQVETDAVELNDFLQRQFDANDFAGRLAVAYEKEGVLKNFIATELNQIRTQCVNIAYRFSLQTSQEEVGMIQVRPTYQLLSRGSIIRFGLSACLGCGILFVLILMDHKVRTEEEFYDLFGESPVAVLKGKDKSQRMTQLVEELSFLCKKKGYSTVGFLYVGKNAKGIAEEVSNGLKEGGSLRVQCCSPEKANELFTCDDILVIYDSEYTTEKQLNNMITSFHQVEANLTGMILC